MSSRSYHSGRLVWLSGEIVVIREDNGARRVIQRCDQLIGGSKGNNEARDAGKNGLGAVPFPRSNPIYGKGNRDIGFVGINTDDPFCVNLTDCLPAYNRAGLHHFGHCFPLRLKTCRDRLRTISISVYEGIRAAYRAECDRQMRKLANEIERTEQIAGPDSHSVRAAKALLGKD